MGAKQLQGSLYKPMFQEGRLPLLIMATNSMLVEADYASAEGHKAKVLRVTCGRRSHPHATTNGMFWREG